MRKLRITCCETNGGALVNLGAPRAAITYVSFDVSAPLELVKWLETNGAYLDRVMIGVALLAAHDASGEVK